MSDIDLNLRIAREIMGMDAKIVDMNRDIESGVATLVLQKSNKGDTTFKGIAYLPPADEVDGLDAYLDLIWPLDDDLTPEMRDYYLEERADVICYDGYPAGVHIELPNYSESLDSLRDVEIKLIEKVGFEQYETALNTLCGKRATMASSHQRARACLIAMGAYQ